MQFCHVTPLENSTKIYLFKWCLFSGPSMLLTHQTYVIFMKSQKYFPVWSGSNFFKEAKLAPGLNIPLFGS